MIIPYTQNMGYPLYLGAVSCFLLNFFLQKNSIDISLGNTVILILSWLLFKKMSVQKTVKPFYFLVAVIPLLQFAPTNPLTPWIIALGLILLNIGQPVGLIFPLLAGLIASHLLNVYPTVATYAFDKERTIFFNVFLNDLVTKSLSQFRLESIIPYSLTFLIYNKGLYGVLFLQNLLTFFTPRNFYDVLLLANLFPLILGIAAYIKNFRSYSFLFFLWIIGALIIIGIDRSPNKFSSLYATTTPLLFFIFEGFQQFKIHYLKIYLALLIVSALML